MARPGPAPLRVVCIGHATLDAIARVDRLPAPDERVIAREGALAGGGPAATAAVTLARLGVAVAFAGRVGDDETGRWIRAGLAAEGVDIASLAVVAGRSAFTVVIVDADGARAMVPSEGDLPPIAVDGALAAACAAAAWVHVDHVGVAAVPALRAAGVGTPVSLDGGNRVPGLSLAGIDLYAPTAASLLERHPGRSIEDALAAALAEGPRLVVATLGAAGCVAAERAPDGGTIVHRAPGVRVPVRSTLGAGDVFHGALLAALLGGRPLPDALRRANAAAAASCRALDGRASIPTREELEALVAPQPGGVR